MASGCLKPPNSPQEVWNLPLMARYGLPVFGEEAGAQRELVVAAPGGRQVLELEVRVPDVPLRACTGSRCR